jgi:acyl carrier protein/NAD(P)-dependent dehydrogenase (short-subunit alcohol dehydrogenase family)
LDLSPDLRTAVARETGYPLEMLTPQMRVNEDLGLDSIKLVEVLSLMAERLGRTDPAPPAALGAATLGDLAAALAAGPGPRPEPAPPEPLPTASSVTAGAAELVFEVVARETGYPRDMLNLSMNLESDLGLDSIKKVEIISALGDKLGLAPPEAGTVNDLVTLADLAALATGGRAGTPPAQAAASLEEILMEVVARETGYPRDMLNPAMDLESDLGLDSIKKVEIMSAVLESLAGEGLAGPAPESLQEARTLGELAGRLAAGTRPEPTRPEPAADKAPKLTRRGPGRPPKNRFNQPPAAGETEAQMAEQTTAYQVEAAPVALAEFSQAARPEGEVVLVADEGPLAEAVAEHFARRPEGGPIRRFTWRSVGDLAQAPETLGSLVMVGPGDGESLASTREAFRVSKTLGPALRRTVENGRTAQALALTLSGGAFGFASNGQAPAASPAEAALAGLFKTAAREWPEVLVRVVDLPGEANLPAAGRYLPSIMAAASALGAPSEMGFLAPDQGIALRLKPYRLKNIRVRHLKPGQTVLVTGGARGVTAAALRELARSWTPHLVILGRTPLIQDEPEWLKDLQNEAAVRQALWRMAEVKPEPRELDRAGAKVLAEREVRTNLAALEKTGTRVTYLSGHFESEGVLKSALAEIKRLYGPIHGFIHGAGVLADSLILDKNETDFDQVFNTKARMARLILEELEDQPLNLAVFFSSSSARFGRRGQADYAAGNEYLNKLALKLARGRSGPKCLSVNWGPWAGGMVGESLARLFQEEGVGLIPLGEGARLFANLVGTPKHDPVEVVVLGRGTRLEALSGERPDLSGARG